MATTIIGDVADTMPVAVHAPLVATKQNWADGWTRRRDCVLTDLLLASSGHDLERCTFVRRYGRVKDPGDTDFATQTPLDLIGHYVRVRMYKDATYQTVWIGQVRGKADEKGGGDPQRTGTNTWVAYGPRIFLMRAWIDLSYWWEDAAKVGVNWCPSFNLRNSQGTLVGNRSAAEHDGSYLFGGTDVWTWTQIVEYVLVNFVTSDGVTNPAWSLTGETGVLDAITDPVRMAAAQSAESLIGRLINRKYGVDYVLRPKGDGTGWDVHIFNLTGTQQTFGTATFPANDEEVTLTTGTAHTVERVKVATSAEHVYGQLWLQGARIVRCFTLTTQGAAPTLVQGWTAAQETAYKAGTGVVTDPGSEHDLARAQDTYRAVYQLFRAADSVEVLAPNLNADGSLTVPQPVPPSLGQGAVRETLPWTPLYEGFDYSTDPATDNNASGVTPDLLGCQAWLYDETDGRWVPADTVGFSVSVLRDTLGVLIEGNPNHLLALNHFAGAADTLRDPRYDWSKIVVTLAMKADWRLGLWHEVAGVGLDLLSMSATGGELWILDAGTTVGVNAAGALLTSGANDRELRNDRLDLHMQMAGMIVRYGRNRYRVEAHLRGFLDEFDLVGKVITKVDQAGTEETVDAPITAVRYLGGTKAMTTIKGGFAL